MSDKVDFLGTKVTAEGIQPGQGMMLKLMELKMPRCKQELRFFLGLCIQLIPYQYCQFKLLRDLQKLKSAAADAFSSSEFHSLWGQVIKQVHDHV